METAGDRQVNGKILCGEGKHVQCAKISIALNLNNLFDTNNSFCYFYNWNDIIPSWFGQHEHEYQMCSTLFLYYFTTFQYDKQII